jgi:hypothetical protein
MKRITRDFVNFQSVIKAAAPETTDNEILQNPELIKLLKQTIEDFRKKEEEKKAAEAKAAEDARIRSITGHEDSDASDSEDEYNSDSDNENKEDEESESDDEDSEEEKETQNGHQAPSVKSKESIPDDEFDRHSVYSYASSHRSRVSKESNRKPGMQVKDELFLLKQKHLMTKTTGYTQPVPQQYKRMPPQQVFHGQQHPRYQQAPPMPPAGYYNHPHPQPGPPQGYYQQPPMRAPIPRGPPMAQQQAHWTVHQHH